MRVLLQRVKSATCHVNGQVIGETEKGYLLLVGLTDGDDEAILAKMAKKIVNLRIFPDDAGKMNLSLLNVGGGILSISQFTLYANTNDGNRPSFTENLNQEAAKVLYEKFNSILEGYGIKVAHGIFGAHMEIGLINDGPVTIMLEF